MKCESLKVLLRDWYQQVRAFNLSPIKMMELVERHIKDCPLCQKDEDLPLEIDQLREIVRVPYVPHSLKSKIEEPQYVFEEEQLEEEEEP